MSRSCPGSGAVALVGCHRSWQWLGGFGRRLGRLYRHSPAVVLASTLTVSMCCSLVAFSEITEDSAVTSVYGEQGRERVEQWHALIARLQGAPVARQLAGVNDFFNRLAFRDDREVWQVRDYWATPREFLGVGAGDCEDFAMAKYETLRRLGVPDSSMRLNYVKYRPWDQFHMVLTWFKSSAATPLVLDNINGEIVPATLRSDLLPIYSFNGSSLWLEQRGSGGQRVGDASRLSQWDAWQMRLNDGTLRAPPR
ncbi:transglutaminase-like cysteine proteinase BTLCP [Kushneria sinocarnis]|uniref:Transglutaminase-like cysteine proteinase BTLCP n=1 Tax=Kushneria sinocarnis TaxID=595502 RepID=A0A420X080_9GAMM|nr:transglutaminase-like cysteine peptidase [Kushneria sinocarnis]RKR06869.1 transglutaminase-like cysteine proteinase BTLCP [Kushneria sinocarnis]